MSTNRSRASPTTAPADGMPCASGMSESATAANAARRPSSNAVKGSDGAADALAGRHAGTCWLKRVSTMWSAARRASAQIVDVGFTPAEVTKQLPSTTYRLGTSWVAVPAVERPTSPDRRPSGPCRAGASRSSASGDRPRSCGRRPRAATPTRARCGSRAAGASSPTPRSAPRAPGSPTESVSVDDRVTAVGLVGQVLAEQAPVGAAPEVRAHVQVMVGAPRLRPGPARAAPR